MARRYYNRDPRWIDSTRFSGGCTVCGASIAIGERALYWPYNRSLNCESCGEPAYARFEVEAQDEWMMAGGGF
jgi:hypothetical protein